MACDIVSLLNLSLVVVVVCLYSLSLVVVVVIIISIVTVYIISIVYGYHYIPLPPRRSAAALLACWAAAP